jgi:hypothetical protein
MREMLKTRNKHRRYLKETIIRECLKGREAGVKETKKTEIGEGIGN